MSDIDKRIAEEVFGKQSGLDCNGNLCWRDEHSDEMFEDEADNGCPNFSTSIADAWLVVEKMKKEGWKLSMSWGNRYHAVFSRLDASYGNSNRTSAPLAICLAALEAKGEDNER